MPVQGTGQDVQYGCCKEYLSCTSYCNCSGEEGYCNPHTKKDKTKDGTEMVVEKDFEDTDMDEDIEEDEGFDTEYFNEDFTILHLNLVVLLIFSYE